MSRNRGICDCRNHIQRQPSPISPGLVLYQAKVADDFSIGTMECMAVQVSAGQSLQSLLLALLELILEVIILILELNSHDGTFHSLARQQASASFQRQHLQTLSVPLFLHGCRLSFSMSPCRPITAQTKKASSLGTQKPSHCFSTSFAKPTKL